MEVGTGRVPRAPHLGDDRIRTDLGSRVDEVGPGVPVFRNETVTMVDDDDVAVPLLVTAERDFSPPDGVDRRPCRGRDVHAAVERDPARERILPKPEAGTYPAPVPDREAGTRRRRFGRDVLDRRSGGC